LEAWILASLIFVFLGFDNGQMLDWFSETMLKIVTSVPALRARSPDRAHDHLTEISPNSLEPFRPSRPSWPSPCTSGNNHSNSKDRKRTSHALALGGAGSAMLFSVAAAI